MGLFEKFINDGGLMNVIRCDEPSYLIWKWRPEGVSGDSNRENEIRWGSSLRVKDGEVAVFVYKQNNGVMQDFIVGPFDETLKTKNLPVLADIVGLVYDDKSPFQAEVYFINLAHIVQVKFGVPYFDIYDPRFLDFGVPVAVRGTISFKIADFREFIKLHRLNTFTLADFQLQIRDAVTRYVKDVVANAPATNNIPVVQIETKTGQINDVIEMDIGQRLQEKFGVIVSGVDISAIEIDKSSEGFRHLMSVTKDVAAATAQAEAKARIKDIEQKQRIEMENYEATLRIQREEGQYAQHKQTQTANIGAYQVEKQTEVGIAGAGALGQMGANGTGSINMGGDGTGFNPAAMMAGIALGGAVGQNIAGTMNGILGGMNQPAPPPIPTVTFHVAVNGAATGPFDMNMLMQMINSGALTRDTLVWKAGMASWQPAGDVAELQSVLGTTPPPVPPIL